jgi:hypothetical protein
MVAFLVFCLVWSRFKGLPGEISTSIEKFVMYGVWDVPNAQELKYDYSPLTFPPHGICLVELQPSSDGAIFNHADLHQTSKCAAIRRPILHVGNFLSPYSGESTKTISWDTTDIAILINGNRSFNGSKLE